ncbi:carbohydrate ABC transporter permease [Paenibacillus puldeungensis]|uniref:Carbohydrate ABC transporter permease n=1 Tax=Paenibacillus puldeungensis TaxID=696536 RepID=A0ABW3S0D5_9BACL
MKIRPWSERIIDAVNVVLLGLIALIMFLPFWYVVATSFASYKEFLEKDIIWFPREWVLSAYEYIFASGSFVRSVLVTIFLTIIGTCVNLIFTATMAYTLSRPVIGQRFVMMLVLFTLLFSAGMIPTYLIVKETGLIDSLWSLILPTAISPFNLIVMRQFFMSIPSELHEAAVIDGANDLHIFSRIILPLSKPSMAAFALFYAVAHWNNYFAGILYLNTPEKWPIQVILRQIVVVGEAQTSLSGGQILLENAPPSETIQMAAIIVATLPILAVYPFLQKHFTKGVMLGSVKG